MTEALSCIIEFCFNQLCSKLVQAKHAVDNKASGKVMIKCGFEKRGHQEIIFILKIALEYCNVFKNRKQ